MIFVISSTTRNTRSVAPLTSTADPSPLALTTVFDGIKIKSALFMAGGLYQNNLLSLFSARESPLIPPMWPDKIRAARLFNRLKVHQFDPRQIRVIHIQLPLAVFPHLRALIPVHLPSVRFQNRLRLFHINHT